MVLPTTKRGSTKIDLAPPQDAIVKAMEVASTPEAAEYLVERFIKRMEGLGPDMVQQSQSVLASLREYSDKIALLYNDSDKAWSGKPVSTNSFQRAQENSVDNVLEEIINQVEDTLTVNFAVNEKSELVRGFVSKEKISDDTATQIDKLLNDFFAKNKMTPDDGVVYEGLNNQGEKQRVSPEKIAEIINKDLASYLQSKGIQRVAVHQRDFPAQTPEVSPGASPGTAA